MYVRVLYNARSGPRTGRGSDGGTPLREALEAAGVAADVIPFDGDTVAAQVRSATDAGVDAVVAAGGDGTVSGVAAVLVGTQTPLGVLPTGTLNHFAKDLGLPLTLPDAARVIAAGRVRAVDVGAVNGRRFINNTSIGLYPHLVSKRERNQQRLGYGKWLAMFVALGSMFRRYPVLRVVVDTGDALIPRTTPFVFVGNNAYRTDLLNLGSRSRLDAGELSLYIASRTGRFGLVRLAFLALIGRLEQVRDFESMALPLFEVQTPKKTLRIAIDGEVTRMAPPLRYEVLPGALNVIGP